MTGRSIASRAHRALGSKLDIYRSKRDFTKTREPAGDKTLKARGTLIHSSVFEIHCVQNGTSRNPLVV